MLPHRISSRSWPLGSLAILSLSLAAGCPLNSGDQINTPVAARITSSTTSGDAPLRVVFSAVESTSENGGPLTYAWDVAGETSSTDPSVTYTFDDPGRYIVALEVTDPTGATGVTSTTVRAAGEAPTAVIQASVSSGPEPLLVRFDGSDSSAPDDQIFDYYWDFGNGDTARKPDPEYVFTGDGEYTVTLRVETAGGVSDTTTTVITVSDSSASLQFNGTQYATLPLNLTDPLSNWTFQAWCKPFSNGGTVALIGNGDVRLRVSPADDQVVLEIGEDTGTASAANLANTWHHLAVVYDETAGATLYFDGLATTNFAASGELSATTIVLGSGYNGSLSSVRLWSVARTTAQINSDRTSRLNSPSAQLVGNWELNEGAGQQLNNTGGGQSGVLGDDTTQEAVDPAWNNDAPPIGD